MGVSRFTAHGFGTLLAVMRGIYLFLLFIGPVSAEIAPDLTPISRYGAVRLVPTADQQDPLSAIVEYTFAAGLSVGDAVARLLRHSGYRLPVAAARSPELSVLFELPLPVSFTHVGPVPLRAALSALVGEPWVPVIDPVYRYVSFDLRPEYRSRFSVPSTGAVVDGAPVSAAARPADEWVIPSLSAKGATKELNELRARLAPNQRVELAYSTPRAQQLLIRSMKRRRIAAERVTWRYDASLPPFGAVARIVAPVATPSPVVAVSPPTRPPPSRVAGGGGDASDASAPLPSPSLLPSEPARLGSSPPPADEPRDDAVAARSAPTPTPTPSPAAILTWTVREGSFRDNLTRLSADRGWAEPVWDIPGDGDFRVHHRYEIHAADTPALAVRLANGYPLKLCIYPVNRTLRAVAPGTACRREVNHGS